MQALKKVEIKAGGGKGGFQVVLFPAMLRPLSAKGLRRSCSLVALLQSVRRCRGLNWRCVLSAGLPNMLHALVSAVGLAREMVRLVGPQKPTRSDVQLCEPTGGSGIPAPMSLHYRDREKERGVMFSRLTKLQTAAGHPSNPVEFTQYTFRSTALLAPLLSALTQCCRITILHFM